jgi:gamma-glutamyl-gamma-aminobutyrate hydrolase PuuD
MDKIMANSLTAAQKEKLLRDTIINRQITLKTHSLANFFSDPETGSKISKTLTKESKKTESTVSIPLRADGGGGGTLFDHRTIQQIAGVPTILAHSQKKSPSVFIEHLRSSVHTLEFGTPTENSMGRNIPTQVTRAIDANGLLYIPGTSRTAKEKQTPEYIIRIKYNEGLIKKARLTGQPILGICGGAWEVWNHFGGETCEVYGHSYRGGMPRLKENGKVGNNKQIHSIEITEDAYLLRASMQVSRLEPQLPPTLTVNSVHWLACDKNITPAEFIVSATALHDPAVAPKKKHNTILQTESGSVEAAESRFGAPILVIQWHPEAYFQNTEAKYKPELHQNIIKYMASAGRAYNTRRQLLSEFQNIINDEQTFEQFKAEKIKTTGLIAEWGSLAFTYIPANENADIQLRVTPCIKNEKTNASQAEQKILCNVKMEGPKLKHPNGAFFYKLTHYQKSDPAVQLSHLHELINEKNVKREYLIEKHNDYRIEEIIKRQEKSNILGKRKRDHEENQRIKPEPDAKRIKIEKHNSSTKPEAAFCFTLPNLVVPQTPPVKKPAKKKARPPALLPGQRTLDNFFRRPSSNQPQLSHGVNLNEAVQKNMTLNV